MELRGKTALVTGGAVRIGRAVCEALAARGCGVVVHYDRSKAAAEDTVAALQALGAPAYAVQGRLTGEADCREVFDRACREAGRVELLVNNAAVFLRHTIPEAGEEAFLATWRVNLLVPAMLTRELARRAPAGRVVNLLDRRVAGTEAGCLPYLLSKQSLADFTRAAALELAPGILVNGVAPGAVLPPPGETSLPEPAGHVPLEVQVTPADVAGAVLFLLASDTITGQVIYVDGGQHLPGTRTP